MFQEPQDVLIRMQEELHSLMLEIKNKRRKKRKSLGNLRTSTTSAVMTKAHLWSIA